MRPIRRILIAVKDPAAKTLPSVFKAAQLARAYGAHLELFHAISTPLYVDAYTYQQSLREIEREIHSSRLGQLQAIARKLRGKGIEISVTAQWDYPAYEAIVRHATHTKASLIVADCHAKPHILPGLLHLTDWELLRMSPIPVLLVKNATPYRRPAVLAAIDPSRALTKPANLDREILSVAGNIAEALHGPLHAVHAYLPLPEEPTSRRLLGDTQRNNLNAQTEAAAGLNFERTVRATHISKSRCHLLACHPITAIEQTARKTRSAIVVMGAISRSGVRRFLFGNTAEYLLDSLPCDLLIVKPPKFSAPLQKRSRGVKFVAPPYVPAI
jgi:universal stress protein E